MLDKLTLNNLYNMYSIVLSTGYWPICGKYLKCRLQGAQKDAQLVVFSKKFKKSTERLMLQQRSKEIGLETILSFRSLRPASTTEPIFIVHFVCQSAQCIMLVSVYMESWSWDYAQDGAHNLTFLIKNITLGEYWDFWPIESRFLKFVTNLFVYLFCLKL